MMMTEISAVAVFLAGIVSFLSPCVLPLVPAYLMYLTGKSAADIAADKKAHKNLILNGALFCIGFSVVFMALGASATALSRFLLRYAEIIKYASGGLIIFLGIFQTGLINIALLNREKRMEVNRKPGHLTSVMMGVAFGFGWTPCIGPVLASVLLVAAQQASLLRGVLLLGLYSLGLMLPFMAIAVFMRFMMPFLNFMKKHVKAVKIISGVILIVLGILIVTDALTLIAAV